MLFAARSATALHRLLDVLPVFAGDERIERIFTLVPGSDFGLEALAALERAGARGVPWERARSGAYDVVLAASPKGQLRLLRGKRVLLPHGAGFSKSVPDEGSSQTASGLDPRYLAPEGVPLADVHALAHPSQVSRLAAVSPRAAERAVVVGDPTLDRLLVSRGLRDRYRTVLGTGGRTLIAVASTWGPESLLQRRPALVRELTAALPYDAYQVALIVHPNERSRLGSFNLAEYLSPALEAGLVLPDPYEEWAAVLVAADAVISDHGSTALYAAALGCPVISAYDGGDELLAGSPMADVLAIAPRLSNPGDLPARLADLDTARLREIAATAFAEQGRALGLLRTRLYDLLGLHPTSFPAEARLLPPPAPPRRAPTSFAIRVHFDGVTVGVERRPAHSRLPADHLAAEHGVAGERHVQAAALLYRRAVPTSVPEHPQSATWTAESWTNTILDNYPGSATAAVIFPPDRCLFRIRSRGLFLLHVDACQENGQLVRVDPATALSAVHAWLARGAAPLPATLGCEVGGRTFPLSVRRATAADGTAPC